MNTRLFGTSPDHTFAKRKTSLKSLGLAFKDDLLVSCARKDLSSCNPCLFSLSWWCWWLVLLPSGPTMAVTMLVTMVTQLHLWPTTIMEPTTLLLDTTGRNEQAIDAVKDPILDSNSGTYVKIL
ncbi:hypothetical protein TNCT_433821 [Trichonephila clavata]|uniref:Uncharacterized protein n=1 Tax=Trichonephila clavata TaxID=2740835 RepID=A0A8X6FCT4_TRICU|nr:hypothetical protein TNCT_433821 [Trichonephila clavata]